MCLWCGKNKHRPLPTEIFYEPRIPVIFKNVKLTELWEGISLIITGTTKPCVGFQSIFIHLICDNKTQDHALLINPRSIIKVILLNTKLQKFWGDEIVHKCKHNPFKCATYFSIQILITDACYMLAVNGRHFAEYKHRVPYNLVKCILVKGDVEEINVDRSLVKCYPEHLSESLAKKVPLEGEFNTKCKCEIKYDPKEEERHKRFSLNGSISSMSNDSLLNCVNPMKTPHVDIPTPYYGDLPNSHFTVGRCLKIDGQILTLAQSFQVALQNGQNVWPQPDVSFLFNIQFAVGTKGWRDYATGSCCSNKNWQEDPPIELNLNSKLRRGNRFSLYIVYRKKEFEVYAGKDLILKFEHRLHLKKVNTVFIQGDLRMIAVVVQSDYNIEDAIDI